MAFKNDLSLSLSCKISLNEQWSEEHVRNVSYTCVRCSRFFQAAVSSISNSRVHFTIERVYKRSRKTKLGNFSKIIHQQLPIFDKNFFIKAQKNSLIFEVFGPRIEGIRLQAQNRTQSFVYKFCSSKAFNGFRRLKKFTMKACN